DDDSNRLREDDWELLKEVCGDAAFFDLQVGLLGVEREYQGMTRRAGVFKALENRLRSGRFQSEDEAVAILTEREEKTRDLKPRPLVEMNLEDAGMSE